MNSFSQLFYKDTHKNQIASYTKILVFIHGNLGSQVYWEPLLTQIQQRQPNYRLVAVDLRGFGRSQQQPTGCNSIEELADDVKNLIQNQLKITKEESSQQLILVGWSLGVLVCMNLGAKYPDFFKAAVYVSSGPITGVPIMKENENGNETAEKCQTKDEIKATKKFTAMTSNFDTKNKAFFKILYSNVLFNSGRRPTDTYMDVLVEETLLQSNYMDTVYAVHEFDISAGKKNIAKNIIGPILIVHGKLDLIVKPLYAEGIVKEIGEQKCKLIVRDDLGHMIPLEDPEYLASIIIDFVQ